MMMTSNLISHLKKSVRKCTGGDEKTEYKHGRKRDGEKFRWMGFSPI